MTTKITPYTFTQTTEFIVGGHRRRLKEILGQCQNPNSEHYGEYILCQNRLTDVLKSGKEQLQGLIYLFVDHTQLVQELKTAQNVCLEDWRLQHFMVFSKQNEHLTEKSNLTHTVGVTQHG